MPKVQYLLDLLIMVKYLSIAIQIIYASTTFQTVKKCVNLKKVKDDTHSLTNKNTKTKSNWLSVNVKCTI